MQPDLASGRFVTCGMESGSAWLARRWSDQHRRPVQQLRQQIDGQALIPPDSAVVPSQRLRSALTGAVALRAAHDPDLSCDLSGGLDSTPIAVLAAHAVPASTPSPSTLKATHQARACITHD
ncbi:asparagine synthase-related protein [Streptomyces sp. WZ-12]|uniref:asparagine synthase-related protein n=1 Tax=Streptomyces sp. WZ-12 TaxID=3030210 RepID=UPI00406C77C9